MSTANGRTPSQSTPNDNDRDQSEESRKPRDHREDSGRRHLRFQLGLVVPGLDGCPEFRTTADSRLRALRRQSANSSRRSIATSIPPSFVHPPCCAGTDTKLSCGNYAPYPQKPRGTIRPHLTKSRLRHNHLGPLIFHLIRGEAERAANCRRRWNSLAAQLAKVEIRPIPHRSMIESCAVLEGLVGRTADLSQSYDRSPQPSQVD